MTPIIVWVAVGVFITADGPQTATSQAYATEGACQAIVNKKVAQIDGPDGDVIIAYGQTCVQVIITGHKLKPHGPKT